jgi:biotin carboxyl carrier protein
MIVMESMKMETPVNAPAAGKILKILVSQGQQVKAGEVLLEWED